MVRMLQPHSNIMTCKRVSYILRRFSQSELAGMPTTQCRLDLRRWMPSRQDYEDHFDKTIRTRITKGSTEHNFRLSKVNSMTYDNQQSQLPSACAGCRRCSRRMRLQWYHSMGSILFDTLPAETLQEDAEQCFTFVHHTKAGRRRIMYDKLHTITYYHAMHIKQRDEATPSACSKKARALKDNTRHNNTVPMSNSTQGDNASR